MSGSNYRCTTQLYHKPVDTCRVPDTYRWTTLLDVYDTHL